MFLEAQLHPNVTKVPKILLPLSFDDELPSNNDLKLCTSIDWRYVIHQLPERAALVSGLPYAVAHNMDMRGTSSHIADAGARK